MSLSLDSESLETKSVHANFSAAIGNAKAINKAGLTFDRASGPRRRLASILGSLRKIKAKRVPPTESGALRSLGAKFLGFLLRTNQYHCAPENRKHCKKHPPGLNLLSL